MDFGCWVFPQFPNLPYFLLFVYVHCLLNVCLVRRKNIFSKKFKGNWAFLCLVEYKTIVKIKKNKQVNNERRKIVFLQSRKENIYKGRRKNNFLQSFPFVALNKEKQKYMEENNFSKKYFPQTKHLLKPNKNSQPKRETLFLYC